MPARLDFAQAKSGGEFGISGGAGFTLLETIVALALVVSAIMGPFALASRGIFGAKFSRSKLIALNLSQEGLELIRAMRENNVLAGADWRGQQGPCANGCTRLQDGSYQPDVYTTANGSPPPVNAGLPLLFDTTASLYSHAAGTPTLFTRAVELSTPGTDQLHVVSIVTWTESGIARQVRLEETLYNWQ